MVIIQNFNELFTFRQTQWWTWFAESVWPNNVTKVEVPQKMDWGGFIALNLCISLIFSSWLSSDLSCESSFSKSPPGGRYQLSTKCEVLFANTFTQIDSESFSSSVMGICEISLWISNITPPPSRVLYFLYTLYGQDSGKKFWGRYGAVNFCLLNCHNLRLMKVKESQQQVFYPLYYWCLCSQISVQW